MRPYLEIGSQCNKTGALIKRGHLDRASCTPGHHEKIKVKAEVVCLQDKDYQTLPASHWKPGERLRTDPTSWSEKEPNLWTPGSQTSLLQSWETIHFYCLSHPVMALHYGSPSTHPRASVLLLHTPGIFFPPRTTYHGSLSPLAAFPVNHSLGTWPKMNAHCCVSAFLACLLALWFWSGVFIYALMCPLSLPSFIFIL